MVLPIWATELGWSATEVSTGASLVLVMMALGSPIAGNFLDRFGAKVILTGGLLALGLGGATSYVSETLFYYLLLNLAGRLGIGFDPYGDRGSLQLFP